MDSEQYKARNTSAQKEIVSLKEKLALTSSEEKNWQRLAENLQKTVTIVTNSRTDKDFYEKRIALLKAEKEKLLTVS
jgi:hypothetical protein